MKKNLLIPLFMVLVFASCTNSDLDEIDCNDSDLVSLRSRIYSIAADYGITDISINDSILNKNISDKEIEKTFRRFSSMNGTFYSICESKEDSIYVCTKSKQRRRSIDSSKEEGSVYGEAFGNIDTLEVRYEVSIDFKWSTTVHRYANLTGFSIKKHVEDPLHSGNYRWEEFPYSNLQQGVTTFSGYDIYFTHDFTITVECNGIEVRKDVHCDYSNGILEVNVQDL